jgi:hypothetical protein
MDKEDAIFKGDIEGCGAGVEVVACSATAGRRPALRGLARVANCQ